MITIHCIKAIDACKKKKKRLDTSSFSGIKLPEEQGSMTNITLNTMPIIFIHIWKTVYNTFCQTSVRRRHTAFDKIRRALTLLSSEPAKIASSAFFLIHRLIRHHYSLFC